MMNKPRYVLIADDDPEDRFLYRKAFEENKISNSIRFFHNGQELLQYLQDVLADKGHMPSLILLDVNMPKMNGKQVLKILKADDSLRSIPVVVVSTSSIQEDIIECHALGADGYQVKPDNFIELKEAIAQLYKRWLS